MLKKKVAAKKQAFAKKAAPETQEKEYDNTNRGVLFENEKENDAQPDFKGSFTDSQGNEFWLAAWQKTAKSGQEYLSISATLKEGK